MDPRLAQIKAWIFDLDNTLYPSSVSIFPQIDRRITDYIVQRFAVPFKEAHAMQKAWFLGRGTTLSGLMEEHGVDPYEYLAFVHDVEMDELERNAPLAAAIARLPGRKIVFTNADALYAGKVLDRLGLSETFEGIHDVHAARYLPKPDPAAYRSLCAAYGLDPATSLFADDMARNLAPAKAIGMATVWVNNGSEQSADAARDHIDFTTTDITHWLHAILEDL